VYIYIYTSIYIYIYMYKYVGILLLNKRGYNYNEQIIRLFNNITTKFILYVLFIFTFTIEKPISTDNCKQNIKCQFGDIMLVSFHYDMCNR